MLEKTYSLNKLYTVFHVRSIALLQAMTMIFYYHSQQVTIMYQLF